VADGEIGLHQPPSPIGKTPSEKKWMLRHSRRKMCGASPLGDSYMTKIKRMQLIFEKLETNGTFRLQEAEWERQARTGRNQSSAGDACKTTSSFTTLGSSSVMLTVVISVETMTQSVAMGSVDIHHGTKVGQGHW